jgi:hypothetical protein
LSRLPIKGERLSTKLWGFALVTAKESVQKHENEGYNLIMLIINFMKDNIEHILNFSILMSFLFLYLTVKRALPIWFQKDNEKDQKIKKWFKIFNYIFWFFFALFFIFILYFDYIYPNSFSRLFPGTNSLICKRYFKFVLAYILGLSYIYINAKTRTGFPWRLLFSIISLCFTILLSIVFVWEEAWQYYWLLVANISSHILIYILIVLEFSGITAKLPHLEGSIQNISRSLSESIDNVNYMDSTWPRSNQISGNPGNQTGRNPGNQSVNRSGSTVSSPSNPQYDRTNVGGRNSWVERNRPVGRSRTRPVQNPRSRIVPVPQWVGSLEEEVPSSDQPQGQTTQTQRGETSSSREAQGVYADAIIRTSPGVPNNWSEGLNRPAHGNIAEGVMGVNQRERGVNQEVNTRNQNLLRAPLPSQLISPEEIMGQNGYGWNGKPPVVRPSNYPRSALGNQTAVVTSSSGLGNQTAVVSQNQVSSNPGQVARDNESSSSFNEGQVARVDPGSLFFTKKYEPLELRGFLQWKAQHMKGFGAWLASFNDRPDLGWMVYSDPYNMRPQLWDRYSKWKTGGMVRELEHLVVSQNPLTLVATALGPPEKPVFVGCDRSGKPWTVVPQPVAIDEDGKYIYNYIIPDDLWPWLVVRSPRGCLYILYKQGDMFDPQNIREINERRHKWNPELKQEEFSPNVKAVHLDAYMNVAYRTKLLWEKGITLALSNSDLDELEELKPLANFSLNKEHNDRFVALGRVKPNQTTVVSSRGSIISVFYQNQASSKPSQVTADNLSLSALNEGQVARVNQNPAQYLVSQGQVAANLDFLNRWPNDPVWNSLNIVKFWTLSSHSLGEALYHDPNNSTEQIRTMYSLLYKDADKPNATVLPTTGDLRSYIKPVAIGPHERPVYVGCDEFGRGRYVVPQPVAIDEDGERIYNYSIWDEFWPGANRTGEIREIYYKRGNVNDPNNLSRFNTKGVRKPDLIGIVQLDNIRAVDEEAREYATSKLAELKRIREPTKNDLNNITYLKWRLQNETHPIVVDSASLEGLFILDQTKVNADGIKTGNGSPNGGGTGGPTGGLNSEDQTSRGNTNPIVPDPINPSRLNLNPTNTVGNSSGNSRSGRPSGGLTSLEKSSGNINPSNEGSGDNISPDFLRGSAPDLASGGAPPHPKPRGGVGPPQTINEITSGVINSLRFDRNNSATYLPNPKNITAWELDEERPELFDPTRYWGGRRFNGNYPTWEEISYQADLHAYIQFHKSDLNRVTEEYERIEQKRRALASEKVDNQPKKPKDRPISGKNLEWGYGFDPWNPEENPYRLLVPPRSQNTSVSSSSTEEILSLKGENGITSPTGEEESNISNQLVNEGISSANHSVNKGTSSINQGVNQGSSSYLLSERTSSFIIPGPANPQGASEGTVQNLITQATKSPGVVSSEAKSQGKTGNVLVGKSKMSPYVLSEVQGPVYTPYGEEISFTRYGYKPYTPIAGQEWTKNHYPTIYQFPNTVEDLPLNEISFDWANYGVLKKLWDWNIIMLNEEKKRWVSYSAIKKNNPNAISNINDLLNTTRLMARDRKEIHSILTSEIQVLLRDRQIHREAMEEWIANYRFRERLNKTRVQPAHILYDIYKSEYGHNEDNGEVLLRHQLFLLHLSGNDEVNKGNLLLDLSPENKLDNDWDWDPGTKAAYDRVFGRACDNIENRENKLRAAQDKKRRLLRIEKEKQMESVNELLSERTRLNKKIEDQQKNIISLTKEYKEIIFKQFSNSEAEEYFDVTRKLELMDRIAFERNAPEIKDSQEYMECLRKYYKYREMLSLYGAEYNQAQIKAVENLKEPEWQKWGAEKNLKALEHRLNKTQPQLSLKHHVRVRHEEFLMEEKRKADLQAFEEAREKEKEKEKERQKLLLAEEEIVNRKAKTASWKNWFTSDNDKFRWIQLITMEKYGKDWINNIGLLRSDTSGNKTGWENIEATIEEEDKAKAQAQTQTQTEAQGQAPQSTTTEIKTSVENVDSENKKENKDKGKGKGKEKMDKE